MRQADRDELMAVCDLSAHEAVVASVRASDPAFLRAHVDAYGRVVCIRGLSPVSDRVAAPWLLGTDLLDAHWRTLHREALRELPRMLRAYPGLSNVVDARQVKVIGWLKRLEFVLREEPAWKVGYPLLRFEILP
ncbi:MAG: hypothetical protein PHW13_11985 [Methylococcales bacterium]|nr:hypothetical protein [Methylococcales bacterium]